MTPGLWKAGGMVTYSVRPDLFPLGSWVGTGMNQTPRDPVLLARWTPPPWAGVNESLARALAAGLDGPGVAEALVLGGLLTVGSRVAYPDWSPVVP